MGGTERPQASVFLLGGGGEESEEGAERGEGHKHKGEARDSKNRLKQDKAGDAKHADIQVNSGIETKRGHGPYDVGSNICKVHEPYDVGSNICKGHEPYDVGCKIC